MQGYRTIIIAAGMLFAPLIARWGFSVDPSALADGMMLVYPAIMAVMRAITRTPLGEKE